MEKERRMIDKDEIEDVAAAISAHMFPCPAKKWPDDFDEYLQEKYRECAEVAIRAYLISALK